MDNDSSFKAIYEREHKARLHAEKRLENKMRELFHINEQLKMNAQALAQSNETLSQFAFIVSHDLKEPLRKIKHFSNLLKQNCVSTLPEEGHNYLNRMQHAVRQMDTLIDGLLNYSYVTQTMKPPVRINLSLLMKEIINDLSMQIAETNAEVTVEEPLPIINADIGQIKQLIQNLLGNSLKFHQKGLVPKVNFSATVQDANMEGYSQCEMNISDNGIGFDEKYSKKVFGIFQRLQGAEEYEGYGIGLAVCKRIVERHNGDIKIKSVPNVGTTFTIVLPIKQDDDEEIKTNLSNVRKEIKET